ncbi:MAG: hypothetical protein COT92_01420, partial [Candidatus Doudnabacteria bacterium CG10_big_fil_rev_8_21_14_0_10_42_18]
KMFCDVIPASFIALRTSFSGEVTNGTRVIKKPKNELAIINTSRSVNPKNNHKNILNNNIDIL